MIRVRWRKDKEWLAGYTHDDGFVWTRNKRKAMKFYNVQQFRMFENVIGSVTGVKPKWTKREIAFMKVND